MLAKPQNVQPHLVRKQENLHHCDCGSTSHPPEKFVTLKPLNHTTNKFSKSSCEYRDNKSKKITCLENTEEAVTVRTVLQRKDTKEASRRHGAHWGLGVALYTHTQAQAHTRERDIGDAGCKQPQLRTGPPGNRWLAWTWQRGTFLLLSSIRSLFLVFSCDWKKFHETNLVALPNLIKQIMNP